MDDQEIRLSPRKTQHPDVERRVLGHPPQSASVYERSLVIGDGDKVYGTLYITQNSPVSNHVFCAGCMHVKTNLLNDIRDVRSSECEVL